MKFDKNLAAIHGYLCGDGYVIKNPATQKHKYYHIGFRNTNGVLLKDFQEKFHAVFGIKPYITPDGRCRIQNKNIYKILTKDYSYYSYHWTLPKLSSETLRFWLRAFFDCEGWVENQPRKSRLIGLDCCNYEGLLKVQESLALLDIKSSIKKRTGRTIWTLSIFGLNYLKMFREKIGFLHPKKNYKLNEAIDSYVNYYWQIPSDSSSLLNFIKYKGRIRKDRGEIRLSSIKEENLINLKKALNRLSIKSKLFGPWISGTGSKFYQLTIKEDQLHERSKIRTSSRDQADK